MDLRLHPTGTGGSALRQDVDALVAAEAQRRTPPSVSARARMNSDVEIVGLVMSFFFFSRICQVLLY